jgi:L-lactate utilization protein LutC
MPPRESAREKKRSLKGEKDAAAPAKSSTTVPAKSTATTAVTSKKPVASTMAAKQSVSSVATAKKEVKETEEEMSRKAVLYEASIRQLAREAAAGMYIIHTKR